MWGKTARPFKTGHYNDLFGHSKKNSRWKSSKLKFLAFFEKIVVSLKTCFIHLKCLLCPGLVSISITHVCILKLIKIAFKFCYCSNKDREAKAQIQGKNSKFKKKPSKLKEITQNSRKKLKTQGKNSIFRHFQNPVMWKRWPKKSLPYRHLSVVSLAGVFWANRVQIQYNASDKYLIFLFCWAMEFLICDEKIFFERTVFKIAEKSINVFQHWSWYRVILIMQAVCFGLRISGPKQIWWDEEWTRKSFSTLLVGLTA